MDSRGEGVSFAIVGPVESQRIRKNGICDAGHISSTDIVYGDAKSVFAITPSDVAAVNQSRAVRFDFGHESVLPAVKGLVRAIRHREFSRGRVDRIIGKGDAGYVSVSIAV